METDGREKKKKALKERIGEQGHRDDSQNSVRAITSDGYCEFEDVRCEQIMQKKLENNLQSWT